MLARSGRAGAWRVAAVLSDSRSHKYVTRVRVCGPSPHVPSIHPIEAAALASVAVSTTAENEVNLQFCDNSPVRIPDSEQPHAG